MSDDEGAAQFFPGENNDVVVKEREKPGRPLRVLVAEDNPVNQEVAAGYLESFDCEITIVDHGANAFEAYKAAPPGAFDLILMDCQMPVMDGLEATRRIRAWECEDRHIPILALTANACEGTRESCLDAGMDDMLNKPLRRQELSALLDRWRLEDRPDDPSETEPDPSPPRSILDLEQLQSLRSLDPDGSKGLLRRTITKFVDYGEGLVATMVSSAADNDMPEIARLAHSLKSSSANLGAIDLARQCQEIETAANDPAAPAEIAPQINALAKSFQIVKQELLALAKT